MDIEGDTIAIGAPYTGSNDEGAVRIYTRTNGAWSQQQTLLATDAGDSDRFGHSVSLSGDTLVVGNRLDDDAGDNSGSALVWQRLNGSWSEIDKLVSQYSQPFEEAGYAVAIDGNSILVGATFADTTFALTLSLNFGGLG